MTRLTTDTCAAIGALGPDPYWNAAICDEPRARRNGGKGRQRYNPCQRVASMGIASRCESTVPRSVLLILGVRASILGVLACGLIGSTPLEGKQASHIIIPSLANASKPSDLDYQGGECDIDQSGKTMECVFQQVFLTVALFDAQTCLVTTSRYERTFQAQTGARWVSTEGPEGECGIVDVATLENEGGTRWTMDVRKLITKKDASPLCRASGETSEVLSWRDVRRTLPCKFVQPGMLSR
jgi:hypothetical protein